MQLQLFLQSHSPNLHTYVAVTMNLKYHAISLAAKHSIICGAQMASYVFYSFFIMYLFVALILQGFQQYQFNWLLIFSLQLLGISRSSKLFYQCNWAQAM